MFKTLKDTDPIIGQVVLTPEGKPVYTWGMIPFHVDAQLVGEHLETLAEQGLLTKHAVLNDARSEESVLHNCFEWDDKKAAELGRLHQAHALLTSISIVVRKEGNDEPFRAVFPINGIYPDGSKVSRSQDQAYQHLVVIMSNPEMRARLLKQALGELNSWRRRYERFEELAIIIKAIDEELPLLETVVA